MGQNQWYTFGVGEFTTHFRTYFSGDVHWGYDLGFDHGQVSGGHPFLFRWGRSSPPRPVGRMSSRELMRYAQPGFRRVGALESV